MHPKKLSSLWKREAGRDFWEGSFKKID